ncbi:carboxypeptidase M32 [Photobacterium kishitanii]|uniref:carboxypeptidase M32 n=1 Tax=Photobacterium kishitanii TaxID=318456 RepID=UPI000434B43C|nr:carboxypeptidase M32 [Photobacterium kishitanii]OBU29218.1 peptidase M32 [Photobacterium kishitanii]PSU86575.1 carboxypeptidase M32 [Photobacterium kishitanii]PSV14907.1 carboxypeptidase M32 [Photobacterium kishitanii]PSW69702.1 carboxypeptidase M32 [Photobacterium kishitanii]CEO39251.1 putative thermostable carboxypeptidase 1 [Photobacterium kishitanii]
MNYYNKLERHAKKLSRLGHLNAICGWDQAAIMPNGGAQARSEAMAELAVISHELATADYLDDWFTKAETEDLTPEQRISLAALKRQWTMQNILPADLVEQQSLAGSQCEHAWRSQRKENNWEGFKANLKPVVELARKEASIRAQATGLSRYDALLDIYEPGMTSAVLDGIFADVKSWLPQLIQQVEAKQTSEVVLPLSAPFAIEQQQALSLEAMKLLGFDFEHGRLDISTHPFCGGVPTDVRITTRYDESDFTSALMGVIHETGHARYEQGLPEQWRDLPVGEARSMGIHESQSLFCEMQLSRSSSFSRLLAPMIQQVFNSKDSSLSVENLYLMNTRVKPGFIRVDADEVTYPAHVILRYEIERDLIEGNIEVDDIPIIWDQKMTQYLGLSTLGNFKDGCMQDIHWTDGSFGYFPSYTLGAMYAAQFMATINKAINVEELVTQGNLAPIFEWLHENIWNKGSTLSTDKLVEQATGETLNPEYFKKHLMERYLNN